MNNYEVDFTNRWNETYKIQKYYVEDIISSENLVVCEDNQNLLCILWNSFLLCKVTKLL